MNKIGFAICLLVSSLGAFARAQQYNGLSINIAFLEGRPATAFGHDFRVGVSLSPRFEIYGLHGTSGKEHYPDQGAISNLKDSADELGFDACLLKIKKTSLCPFMQAGFHNTKTVSFYPDGDGGTVRFPQSTHDWLWTAGLHFDQALIGRRLSIVGDIGPNFAGGWATECHRVYFVVGAKTSFNGIPNPVSFLKKHL